MKHVQAKCTKQDCGGGCEACCLAVCSVCGCYEGSLTTECPGVSVSFDKQQEIYNDCTIDYSTEKGWYTNEFYTSLWDRVALFEDEHQERLNAKEFVADVKESLDSILDAQPIVEYWPPSSLESILGK